MFGRLKSEKLAIFKKKSPLLALKNLHHPQSATDLTRPLPV